MQAIPLTLVQTQNTEDDKVVNVGSSKKIAQKRVCEQKGGPSKHTKTE